MAAEVNTSHVAELDVTSAQNDICYYIYLITGLCNMH